MDNLFLTPGLIKMAGLVGSGDRDYLRNIAEDNAQRRAAIEAANAAGKRKLLHLYETGEGYEPFMDPHIASHFGVKAKDLNDPRVLNLIYKRLTGVPHEILQNSEYEGSIPTMGPVGTRWNPGGSAMDSDYRNAILKRIKTYAAQKSNNFTNTANSSLGELGQYSGVEDAGIPDFNIEDPNMIEDQARSTPPVVNTRMPEVPIASPALNPVIYPVDKTDYTNRLNEAQNQLSQERDAVKVAPKPVHVPAPATSSPSLPSSALTSGGGEAVNFQTPHINIPEFNPSTVASTSATQNPFYSPNAVTRQQMRQYRRYTGANNMKSDMDRWKTYQAMNGNRNASNADYYTAKRTNTLDKVVNPVTAKSK